MIKNETRVIDGLEITTTQLPAMRGFKLFTKVVKILAPVLGELRGMEAKELETFLAKDVSAIAPLVLNLFSQLENPDAIVLEVLSGSSVKIVDPSTGQASIKYLGDQASIDYAFAGKVPTMIKAMMFSLEVNFRDFIAGAFAKPSDSAPAADKASQ